MLLVFLMLMAFLGLRVALRCRSNTARLIAIGCTTLLIGQSLMNLAVASGSMPTTGLPLPMVSYGGNSLSSLLVAGLLIRCSLESTSLVGVAGLGGDAHLRTDTWHPLDRVSLPERPGFTGWDHSRFFPDVRHSRSIGPCPQQRTSPATGAEPTGATHHRTCVCRWSTHQPGPVFAVSAAGDPGLPGRF